MTSDWKYGGREVQEEHRSGDKEKMMKREHIWADEVPLRNRGYVCVSVQWKDPLRKKVY